MSEKCYCCNKSFTSSAIDVCDEKVLQVNFVLDKQEQDKVIRQVFGEANSSTYLLQSVDKKNLTFTKSNENIEIVVNESEERDLEVGESPNEVNSYESFQSCHSLSNNHDFISLDDKNKTSPQFSKSERATNSVDSLQKQFTLVNAIFLNNCARQKAKEHHAQRKDQVHLPAERKRSKASSLSSPITSRRNNKASKIFKPHHSPEPKPRKKHISEVVTNPFINRINSHQNSLEDDIFDAKANISKNFRIYQWIPVYSSTSEETVEESKTKAPSLSTSQCNILKTERNIKFDDWRALSMIKIPERCYEEVILTGESNYFLTYIMNNKEKIKHRSDKIDKFESILNIPYDVRCCENDANLNSSRYRPNSLPWDSFSSLNSTNNLKFGDGDCSSNAEETTVRSGVQEEVSNTIFEKIDESSLRKLVRKILYKIHIEPTCSSGTFNNTKPTELCVSSRLQDSDENSNCTDGDESKSGVNADVENNGFNKSNIKLGGRSLNDKEEDFKINDLDVIWTNNGEEEREEEKDIFAKSNSGKRKRFRRTRPPIIPLPVIKEESSTEKLEESAILRGKISVDDLYLVDSKKKPICLFDCKGLPLTDHSGRVLKSAKGEPLLKCDENGFPIVDKGNCDIFDMLGRHPLQDDFEPSMAPKMVTSNKKLSTRDGKPLLLFDCEGRPLTSVSGTILLDSKGKGLVKIS